MQSESARVTVCPNENRRVFPLKTALQKKEDSLEKRVSSFLFIGTVLPLPAPERPAVFRSYKTGIVPARTGTVYQI